MLNLNFSLFGNSAKAKAEAKVKQIRLETDSAKAKALALRLETDELRKAKAKAKAEAAAEEFQLRALWLQLKDSNVAREGAFETLRHAQEALQKEQLALEAQAKSTLERELLLEEELLRLVEEL